ETPERKHAAGIACQRNYHDAVIRFRFQFSGGRDATLLLRNKFGNLCRLIMSPTTVSLQKDKPNLPKDTPEKTEVLEKKAVKLEAGKWYSVTATVRGEEFTAEIQGVASLKGRHAAINVDKTEIEFMASGDSILYDDLMATVIPPK
ncbi:MAG TPA: hypothetical protein VK968_03365, partial [Roseimicrobium sp.]|nr:hypothetical protein [Roseimicrobium sp.]